MEVMRASRKNCAAPVSSMKPIPPCTWMPSEAMSIALSVDQAFTIGIMSSTNAWLRARRVASGWQRAVSVAAAVTQALARVRDGDLVGALGDADALEPHGEAGRVHRDEHVLEAAVLLPDEPADRAVLVAEGEHRGRARVDSELVLERHAADVVPGAEAPVRVDEHLRHDEERDALHALRRVRRPREDEVDDVLGEVVVAVGDEDLLPLEAVGAVLLRHRARADRGEVRPGPGLGQHHRAGPLARGQLREVPRLQLRRALRLERIDGAAGEHRAEGEREVRGVPHLLDEGRDEAGHALAAVLRLDRQGVPPAVYELPVGVAPASGGGNLAVLHAGALEIADDVEGGEHAAGELRRLLEDRLGDLERHVPAAGELRDLLERRELAQDELHVAKGGGVIPHGRDRKSTRLNSSHVKI